MNYLTNGDVLNLWELTADNIAEIKIIILYTLSKGLKERMQQIPRLDKRKIFYLLVNYNQTPSPPLCQSVTSYPT